MYDANAAAEISPGGDIRSLGNAGLLAAMRFNQHGFKLSSLRANDTLRHEEWIYFHDIVVEETMKRLTAVNDLITAGLTVNVPNAMGKTQIQFEDVTEMQDAETSLDGLSRTRMDAQVFSQTKVPNGIVHKDWFLTRRVIEASRTSGEPLPTTNIRAATKKVNEMIERNLIRGSSLVVEAGQAYGYTNHPDRNTLTFGVSAWNAAGVNGDDIESDVLRMRQALVDDGYHGPYNLYIPSNFEQVMDKLYTDGTTTQPRTVRDLVLGKDRIQKVAVLDELPSSEVVLVSMERDVVEMAIGEMPQTVQWDFEGGMGVNFKVMAIMTALVKSSAAGKSGIAHLVGT